MKSFKSWLIIEDGEAAPTNTTGGISGLGLPPSTDWGKEEPNYSAIAGLKGVLNKKKLLKRKTPNTMLI